MERLIWAGGMKYAKFLVLLTLVLSLASCDSSFFSAKDYDCSYMVKSKHYHILALTKEFRERGVASWYR